MRIITIEDIRDIYIKLVQRGAAFALSKFSFNSQNRTKSSFNCANIEASYSWIVPEVRKRWNYLISGDENQIYEEYVSNNYFQYYQSLKMVSIGSGFSSHELKLAELNPHWEITCIDFSNEILNKASQLAKEKGLVNIKFLCENIYEYEIPKDHFDIVFFHASLHHFKNLDEFIKQKVLEPLKPGGHLIINEFVGANRMQFKNHQIKAINECLDLIPPSRKKIFKTNLTKNRYYSSGLLRMIVADPSECIESENILPTIYKYFDTVVEKPFGGNIIVFALKDIAHNFLDNSKEKDEIIKQIFDLEDRYLEEHHTDFIFGIYQKK